MTTPEQPREDWLKPRKNADRSGPFRRRSRMENGMERVLRDWYGDTFVDKEIEGHQGSATPIGTALDGFFQQFNHGECAVLRKIIEAWPTIIGFEYARFTLPGLLEQGKLSIEIFNSSIQYKLNPVKKDLLLRVQTQFPQVKEIVFIPGGRSRTRPATPEQPPKRR